MRWIGPSVVLGAMLASAPAAADVIDKLAGVYKHSFANGNIEPDAFTDIDRTVDNAGATTLVSR